MRRAGHDATNYDIANGDECDLADAAVYEAVVRAVEADEYDSAFFDKRSKFVHYHSNTLVMNNLEFDHGDIFDDLAAIQRQFHHVVRTLPSTGHLIYPVDESNLQQVVDQGCWSHIQTFSEESEAVQGAGWRYRLLAADGSHFQITDSNNHSALINLFL